MSLPGEQKIIEVQPTERPARERIITVEPMPDPLPTAPEPEREKVPA